MNIESYEQLKEVYNVLIKATNYDRDKRYKTIKDFHKYFNEAINK